MPKGVDVTEADIRRMKELDSAGLSRKQICGLMGLCKDTLKTYLGRKKTHGMHRTPTYSSWVRMWSRCVNPKNPSYHRYGGRGIAVDRRWEKFENFVADMGERPEGTSLDRINNDGNYEPGNCRWATDAEQNRNRSDNIFVEYGGERMIVSDWAKRLGISMQSLLLRLKRWPLELALTLEPNKNRRLFPKRKYTPEGLKASLRERSRKRYALMSREDKNRRNQRIRDRRNGVG